uniref:CAP-Gly domain containing linker protein family member 4 n=1 Tax=Tetraodon nigroviridis TaxID=99883 RepID=H3CU30_TETNG
MTKEDVSEELEGDPVLGWLSSRQRPVIHQVASAPMPSDCEFSFFDPSDPQCRGVLLDPGTTIPELFAVLRQWVPQVQRNIRAIGHEILKRGCGVNDRDGLTDMSLLHFCCKAGAQGIGDADAAADFARQLLALGADPNLRSRWTNMRALHYAAYFDVPQLIRVVMQASHPGEVDATCSDFDFGTALHIAASNLCLSAVQCLLELGANPAFRNEKGLCPADVVPDPLDMPLEMAASAAVAKELRTLLRPLALALPAQRPPALSEKAKAQLASMGIRMGDCVVIAGQKVGTLQFCGSTEFSGGLWAGVELDKPEGKNDGSVAGVQYFTCRMKYGIFAPLSKISKALERNKASTKASTPPRPPRHIDSTRLRPKFNTGEVLGNLQSTAEAPLSKVLEPQDARKSMLLRSFSLPLSLKLCTDTSDLSQRSFPQNSFSSIPFSCSGFSHSLSSSSSSLDKQSASPPASSSVCRGPEVRLGERVLVAGQRTGVVKFCGKTNFAPGIWLGIKLDKPSGKNDGSVGGVRYFSCPPKHGVFAPPSRVQRIHGSVDCLSELSSSRLAHSFSGEVRIRRSSSTSSAIASQKRTARSRPVTRSRSNPQSQRWSPLGGGGASDGQVRLHVGMQVLLSSANEMASIRYLGTADFAPGIWLGLELRSPKGKNDGSVGGRRYFSCRAGHGVLVRPSRVTYRGINGSRLLNDGQ